MHIAFVFDAFHCTGGWYDVISASPGKARLFDTVEAAETTAKVYAEETEKNPIQTVCVETLRLVREVSHLRTALGVREWITTFA